MPLALIANKMTWVKRVKHGLRPRPKQANRCPVSGLASAIRILAGPNPVGGLGDEVVAQGFCPATQID